MKTTLAPAAGLALGIGRNRDLCEVKDLADASRIYRAAVLRHERETASGSSTMPTGYVYEVCGAGVRRIATVSYNGKVWRGTRLTLDAALLFDPYATAAGAK